MILLLLLSSSYQVSGLKFLTSPWTPLVNCVPGSKNISKASGYYIDLIKKINSTLSLSLDFECLSFKEMMSFLETNPDSPTFAGGCISITHDRLKSLKFSTPTYDSGIIILTKKSPLSLFWLVFLPFDATLWTFMVFIIIFHSHLIWIAEQSEKGPIVMKYSEGIMKSIQHSCLSIFLMGDLKLKTIPGRMVQICYWFLGFILLGVYLANMAAILSIDWQSSDIESFQDLKGKKVAGFEDFEEELKQYSSKIKTYSWSYEESNRMVDDLQSGKIDAAAMPYPFALYLSKKDCDLLIVGQRFIVDYFAFAFPKSFDDDLYKKITKANLDLYSRSYHRNLENKFVLVTNTATCDYSADIPLSFKNIGGIWVVIGIEGIFGIIFAIIVKFRKNKQETVQASSPTQKSLDLKEAAEIDLISKFEKILKNSEQKMIQKIKDYNWILTKSSENHTELKEALQNFSSQIRRFS